MNPTRARFRLELVVSVLVLSAMPIAPLAQAVPLPPKELQLSVKEFDQDAHAGWRRLQHEGKYLEAAQLIDRYEKDKQGLNGGDRLVLCFHAAQMYAFGGDCETALGRLQNAKYPPEVLAELGEDRRYADAWNVYVDATAAFLRKDRDVLTKCLALLEKGPKDLQQNTTVVRQLLDHFNDSYLVAYRGNG